MPKLELNLRDYWHIIRKRRIVFIVIFSAILALTIAYTQIQKPIYRAIASVQWVERKTLGSLLTDIVTTRPGDPLTAQTRVITSLPVLENVVIELGMAGKDASEDKITEKARELQSFVTAETIPDTNIIRIIVMFKNPQAAAVLANKIAKDYIQDNLREKSKQSRSVREFIESQLGELSIKLKNAEDQLARFKEVEVPSGAALALENRLNQLEQRKQELSELYTNNHPEVKNIYSEIEAIKKSLQSMPKKELEYGRLTREVEIDSKLYKELKEKLEAARIAEAEKIEDVSLVDAALPSFSPVSPNKPLNYLLGAVVGLLLGLTGTFVFEQIDTSIGTIEDVEDYLKLPVLGVIPYLRTRDEKESRFSRRIWQKRLKGGDKAVSSIDRLIIHFPGSSPVFEAYRILRTKIQTELFKEKIQGKVILVSSSGPEEGKSLTVSNLAIAMAQGGLHTLLIDADLRRSSIHKIFGLKDRPLGLTNILRESLEPKQAISKFTDIIMGQLGIDETLKIPGLDNLNILTSGSLASNTAELLSSQEMQVLLEKLKEKYDLILIDSPPVLAVADAVILAPKVDAVILVYQVGKISRSILIRTKNQLMDAGAKVKGIILNNVSPEVEVQYGHYYYYKYYGKYYANKADKKEVA